MVAPNSPSARDQLSSAPEKMEGATSGSVTRVSTRQRPAPRVRADQRKPQSLEPLWRAQLAQRIFPGRLDGQAEQGQREEGSTQPTGQGEAERRPLPPRPGRSRSPQGCADPRLNARNRRRPWLL